MLIQRNRFVVWALIQNNLVWGIHIVPSIMYYVCDTKVKKKHSMYFTLDEATKACHSLNVGVI